MAVEKIQYWDNGQVAREKINNMLQYLADNIPSIWENGHWYLGETDTWISATWPEWPQWPQGEEWPQWPQGEEWPQGEIWPAGPEWPQWPQGVGVPTGWSNGQVLTQSDNWPVRADAPSWLPSWWTTGQILMMTANWPARVTPEDNKFMMLSPDSPETLKYMWLGTDTQYGNLQNYDQYTQYNSH